MIGKAIGYGFVTARDAVARVLIALRVRPNTLTITGTLFTAGAGVCYAIGSGQRFAWSLDPHADGAGAWLLLAAALLILSSACDMLDGAVARLGNQKTQFGGFLDSTLDRYSDFAVFAGMAIYYAIHSPPNITFVLGAMLAFVHGFMIAYTRARAEDIIPQCKIGYWQRGERSAAILIATLSYNIPALIVQQAILPALTVLRRVMYTKAVIEGKPRIEDPRQGGWWLKVRLWRWPRMTWPYDIVTGINIAWLIWGGPVSAERWDVIRQWFMR